MKISNLDTSKPAMPAEDTSPAQANLSFYNLIFANAAELQALPQQQSPPLLPPEPLSSQPAELLSDPTVTVPTSVPEIFSSSPTVPQNIDTPLDAIDNHPVMSQLNFVQHTLGPMELPVVKVADKKNEKTVPSLTLPINMNVPENLPTVPILPANESKAAKNSEQNQEMKLPEIQLPGMWIALNAKPNSDNFLKKINNLPVSKPISAEGIFSVKSQSTTLVQASDAEEMMQVALLKTTHLQPLAEDKVISQPQTQLALHAFTQVSDFIHGYTLAGGSLSQAPLSATFVPTTDTFSAFQQAAASRYEPQIDIVASSIGPFLKESYDAKIKIYPPDLGSVLAKLKIEKGSAQLILLTESARVKEIVEANLPQLQQQFKQADISLTHVEVQSSLADFTDQTSQDSQDFTAKSSKENTNNIKTPVISSNESPKDPNKIIDTYA